MKAENMMQTVQKASLFLAAALIVTSMFFA